MEITSQVLHDILKNIQSIESIPDDGVPLSARFSNMLIHDPAKQEVALSIKAYKQAAEELNFPMSFETIAVDFLSLGIEVGLRLSKVPIWVKPRDLKDLEDLKIPDVDPSKMH